MGLSHHSHFNSYNHYQHHYCNQISYHHQLTSLRRGVHAHTHCWMCILSCFLQCFLLLYNAALGGEGGGRNNRCNWWYRGDVNVPCNLLTLLMLRHAGVGGMLAFHITCSRCWCYATLAWGGMLAFHVTCSHCWCYATLGWGDVNVPCNLLRLLMLRHTGEGGVSVPCNLLTLLMLRHAGMGGMLAFHVTCSRCWCYATLGWGGC